MSATVQIDIGICTFRRPELAATLRSLAAVAVPPSATLRVIVADNDTTSSAKALVESLRPDLPFEITYVHCPASNISIARNACLDNATGEFLAFIDDDETASSGWLVRLLEEAQATGADAVLGPVRAHYAPSAPAWMRHGDFHSTFPVWVKSEIRTGYTCNALLRLRPRHSRAAASSWHSAGAEARTRISLPACTKPAARSPLPRMPGCMSRCRKAGHRLPGLAGAASAPARPTGGC